MTWYSKKILSCHETDSKAQDLHRVPGHVRSRIVNCHLNQVMKYVKTANVITCNIGRCNLRHHLYIRKIFLKTS